MSRSVMIDLDDPRMGALADVLTNKSSKRILSLLADSELSTSELASELKMPLTTVDYNVKKLARAGLIEKTRSLMSAKGKIVPVYRVSERSIVITPKRMLRGIVPGVIVAGVVALGLKIWETGYRAKMLAAQTASAYGASSFITTGESADMALKGTEAVAQATASDQFYHFLANAPNSWAVFFIGALCALCVVVLWNWFKKH
jgi:DNA-binding transcriptional ArsR family regulator